MTLLPRSRPGSEGRRRPAVDAVGGRPSEDATGSQSRRRSVHVLPPAGRASRKPPQPVQDRADAADDDLSARVVRRQHVPADLHRRPAAAEVERDRAGVAGIFGRPLGGRRLRRGEHRIPRSRLAQREHGVPQQRRPARDRALAACRLRSPRRDRHHRRSQGVREAVDEQDHPGLPGGHRAPRFVLRQPDDHAGALQHGPRPDEPASPALPGK